MKQTPEEFAARTRALNMWKLNMPIGAHAIGQDPLGGWACYLGGPWGTKLRHCPIGAYGVVLEWARQNGCTVSEPLPFYTAEQYWIMPPDEDGELGLLQAMLAANKSYA
jgi:hypothetical protein